MTVKRDFLHIDDLTTDEIWQVDARRYPVTISAQGEEVRPWFVCVADVTNGDILALDVEDERPAPKDVWESLSEQDLLDMFTYLHDHAYDSPSPAKCS